jgi:beta-lactamase regulating signal transducer with metallopeptidase domain
MISSILVEAALRSALLAVAVWIGLRIFGVRNVLAQKCAWGLVLAGALSMPVVLSMASHWTVLPANVRVVLPADPQTLLEELQARIQAKTSPKQPAASDAATASSGGPQVEQHSGISINEPVRGEGSRNIASTEPESSSADASKEVRLQPTAQTEFVAPRATVPQRAAFSLTKIILVLYLTVAGVFLVRLAFGLVAALRLYRRAKPISGDLLTSSARLVDLRCSLEVSSPVTIWSTIVLPADYATWDSEKLRVVLAHERSHIRQRDFYLQLLAGAYAAAFWPSPLGWWLKRKLSDLAEAISDRAGLEEAADRTSYAQILLEFAASPRPTFPGVAMANSGSLSRRIERLLNDVSFRQAFAGSRRALVAVAVVPVVLFAATALVRVEASGQQAPESPAPAGVPSTPSLPGAPSLPGLPAGGVSVPDKSAEPVAVAPVAPQSGVSQPVQILDEPAAAAPAVAPAPPAKVGAPASLPAPAAPYSPSMLTIAPAAPSAPRVLTVVPLSPERRELMMTAIKNREIAAKSLIMVAPVAPSMAVIAPRGGYGVGHGYGVGQSATTESGNSTYSADGKHSGYHYSYSSNGQSYAVIRGGDTQHMTFSGNWIEGRREEIAKAGRQAHGDFLWFTRDDKAYYVDDPAILGEIEAMYKPMEALGAQQEALGKRQEAIGKQQEELGRQQEKASIPTPDMSKEIAKIDEAMAKLKASQGKNMTQDDFGQIQERLGELQARMGELQGRIGERQGEFGMRMGELGEKMGALGAQMGELGAQQGKIAQQADQKIRSIIDDSLKNGKAHLVQ